jgi:two-component system LytT family response regulator
MIRAVIIEDEAENLERLVSLLDKHCPEVDLIGNATNVEDAYILIEKKEPELVFLDIQLTDGTGFDLLEKLGEIQFKLIFITAFEKYAVKAFRFSAIDFLLKPVDPDELTEAVARVIKQIDSLQKLQYEQVFNLYRDKTFNKIILRDSENIYLVDVDDIILCRAEGNYTEFKFESSPPILVSRGLKEYDDMLHDSKFMRIHRSYLINLNHLKHYKKSKGGQVVLSDGSLIPVASGKKEELFEFLKQFRG